MPFLLVNSEGHSKHRTAELELSSTFSFLILRNKRNTSVQSIMIHYGYLRVLGKNYKRIWYLNLIILKLYATTIPVCGAIKLSYLNGDI
jgi:hypothetical protein